MDESLLETQTNESSSLRVRTWVESKKIWTVAFPGILSRVSFFGMLIVTQAFIGHIDELDLAAFALVQTFSFRFGNGILLGMSSATETLCGQAFGAKQYHMLGVYLQRSWIINLVAATVMLPIFIFATPLYRLLGQEEDIAIEAGKISLWFIPIYYQMAASLTMVQYLQAQLKNKIVAWLSAASFVIHVLVSWIFVIELNLGTSGALGAFSVSSWLLALGQFIYVFGGWCPETWTGFSMAAFTDLWPVIKMSVSSGIMLCLEMWYNAFLVLVAGYLKNAEIAISAFSICLNVITWEFMVCLGFLGAACVRVANELGRGDANAVKFSIKVISFTSVIISVSLFILCLIFGHEIAYLFTSNEEIAEVVSSLSVFLSFSILLNGVQPVLSGIAVGSGRQGIVAYVNVVTYYIIGLPLGLLLGYVADLEIKGIWIGMLSGVLCQTLVLGFITWRTDWDKQVNMASDRLKKWLLEPTEEPIHQSNGEWVAVYVVLVLCFLQILD